MNITHTSYAGGRYGVGRGQGGRRSRGMLEGAFHTNVKLCYFLRNTHRSLQGGPPWGVRGQQAEHRTPRIAGGRLATLVVLKLCCFLYPENGKWWLEKDRPNASWRSFLGLEPKEETKALPDGSEPVQACCVRCASNPIWLSLLLC